jgi:putative alpha-1,2-mannosidase
MPSWIPSAAALVSVTAVSAGTTDYHGRNIKHPEEYINVLGGTDSRYDMSHGNTLPLHTRPWGMNSWALYTDTDPTYSGWWFHPTDRRMFGMR